MSAVHKAAAVSPCLSAIAEETESRRSASPLPQHQALPVRQIQRRSQACLARTTAVSPARGPVGDSTDESDLDRVASVGSNSVFESEDDRPFASALINYAELASIARQNKIRDLQSLKADTRDRHYRLKVAGTVVAGLFASLVLWALTLSPSPVLSMYYS
jgi:hypothetical protein